VPELPEVQTIVNDLIAAGVQGRAIVGVRVFWPGTLDGMPAEAFARRVQGKVIECIRRRGKFILLECRGATTLAVYLRMTGRFQLLPAGAEPSRHVHVILDLDDGRCLRFHDTRKFGRFYLAESPEQIVGRLGPEPLDRRFTAGLLARCLAGRRRDLKPLLLDQSCIAGLGNIYVDEALWAAGLHPLRRSDTLSSDQIALLHRAIRQVLRLGLKNAGTTLGRGQGNFYSLDEGRGGNDAHLKVFRRTGEPCPRCRRPIERLVVAQRSTHICPVCQK
jgi:formamidopyrimidine-DNA glycosylase